MDYHFQSGKSYAITGSNGSGKSTLLRIISGSLPASEGTITYKGKNESVISPDLWPRHIAYAAPYLEVIEEFTLKELLEFHFSFKSTADGIDSAPALAEKMYLQDSLRKQIKYFSSGMKQRLKLGLAFFTKTDILFLDEPTSNLDFSGIDWYLAQIEEIKKGRLLIICSNQPNEYSFCDYVMDISSYKGYKSHK